MTSTIAPPEKSGWVDDEKVDSSEAADRELAQHLQDEWNNGSAPRVGDAPGLSGGGGGGGGDEKRTGRPGKAGMADEELARHLQDECNGGSSNPYRNNPPPPVDPTNGYAPPSGPPPSSTSSGAVAGVVEPPRYSGSARRHHHSNPIIEAGKIRAKDEASRPSQTMQNWLQQLQLQYGIYNSELEPEHESDYPCGCPIHQYMRAKWARCGVQDLWNAAVVYPGEKAYNGNRMYGGGVFSGNPYQYRLATPWSPFSGSYGPKVASAKMHYSWTKQTIALNNSLNQDAQAAIDSKEPKVNIWDDETLHSATAGLNLEDKKEPPEEKPSAEKGGPEKGEKGEKLDSSSTTPSGSSTNLTLNGSSKSGKFSKLRKSLGIKSTEERQVRKTEKAFEQGQEIRKLILDEEAGRWPDDQWREIVHAYQEKTGMVFKIAELRARRPIQYLHLLRAGYFEPIPVAWAQQASNPLKFTIESIAGWRGITPAWRGYEDTAEERLYWVLNHREGTQGTRLKPDFISALDLARQRMDSAVPPPPEYFDNADVCHVQHTTDGYSKQVMPAPFKAYDRPKAPTDDTMILLDVSGSMDFDPLRPNYDRYLITGYGKSTQPKNKDVAKAVIRRFTDAMVNYDHDFGGYDLVTFSSQASYVGKVNHINLDPMWSRIRIGGGTRVMTGWQKVKERHFEKHSESAIHHPVYGWQAGPNTPMLRLLLLLDGEATDMDEFELDLLGLSWAHVTIFLIGVDGCPHHHRHANELQRISDVNHHVSFVDAQGNTPERFVTHELLKRHLGYEISMSEFQQLELPPTYHEATR